MPALAMKQEFSRAEVRRMLRVSEKQLKAWERQHFLEPAETYGVGDLVALRSLIQLKKNKVQPAQIQKVLSALTRKLQNVTNPLTQLKIYADGKRVRVDLDGSTMEAESGQLLLDFGTRELNRLLEFRAKDEVQKEQKRRAEAEHWFERGLDLEQKGAPVAEVVAAYEKAIELDPRSAGALVNLGTIYFNARSWIQAEKHYKRAIEADSQYALAHFDLANLYDERGDQKKALEHYLIALQIAPTYADAHYNVALLYQGTNQPMKAVQHWTTYLKLDPTSHWATIARRELQKLRQAAVVPGAGKGRGTA